MSLLPSAHFLKGIPPLKSVIFFLLLYALAWLFFYAGAVKLGHLSAFYDDILNYRILNRDLSWFLALYLPWLEIGAAGALLWPRFRGGALLALAGLLVVFLAAIVSAWIRGLDITCGCFGSGGGVVDYPTLIVRDLLLLAVTGALNGWGFQEG